jgi:predicted Zn-dependent protease/thioredoxin-related protein
MTMRVSLRLMSLCCACCLMHAVAGASASAQEVEWRQDYGKARKEAEEKNRPLVIDVGTSDCFWCKQLDLRTFKDPAIVAMLNERCIPLKINAEQHAGLVAKLRVDTYPTLVFATAKGTILGYQQGFIEPIPLQQRMNALFTAAPPAGGPNRELHEATQAVAAGDYPRAIALLKPVVANSKDQPIQNQAKQMLQDLEKQAAGRCAEARQLVESGKVPQAVETVTGLVRDYPGTQAAREGGQLLVTLASRVTPHENSRTHLARELLDQAREDRRKQQFLSCLDRCETLSATYPDMPETVEANKLATEIKANPEWTKQACDQMGERLSLLYLTLAETWLKKGQPQQAIFYLERIVQTFPNTRNADIAQVRLAQIQGPSRMPGLKK